MSTSDLPSSGATDPSPTPTGPSRRTVVKAAAWSVPVISLSLATPAHAASADAAITTSFDVVGPQPISSELPAVAHVLSKNGRPLAGETVTFTVSGPATFSGGSLTTSAATDASGAAHVAGATGLTAGLVSGSVALTASCTGAGTAAASIDVQQTALLSRAARRPAGFSAEERALTGATGNLVGVDAGSLYWPGQVGGNAVTAVTSTGEVWIRAEAPGPGVSLAWTKVDDGADVSVRPASGFAGTSSVHHYSKAGQLVAVSVSGGAASDPAVVTGSPTGVAQISCATQYSVAGSASSALTVVSATGGVFASAVVDGGTCSLAFRSVATGADPTKAPATVISGAVTADAAHDYVRHAFVAGGVLQVVRTRIAGPQAAEAFLPIVTDVVGVSGAGQYWPAQADRTATGSWAFTAVTGSGVVQGVSQSPWMDHPWRVLDSGADATVRPATVLRGGKDAQAAVHYYSRSGQVHQVSDIVDVLGTPQNVHPASASGTVAALTAASQYFEDNQTGGSYALTLTTSAGEAWGRVFIGDNVVPERTFSILSKSADPSVVPATSVTGTAATTAGLLYSRHYYGGPRV